MRRDEPSDRLPEAQVKGPAGAQPPGAGHDVVDAELGEAVEDA